ncbi:hypothetical protein SAMN05216421_1098 [Halopseudomonas xinjiangensis]|uniref:Phage antitermination protein Q n=1 Tax=Halopseudomonas xinjiangensis TaxID=487184 RepID=A0A1H1QB18_9GAMM|nr:hypothetical protein SAMN05216421_1098 [Halopseudomonas xinjiangensis]
MTKCDAENLLQNWGRWVWYQAGVPTYTSPLYALMRDNVAQTSAPTPAITDDEAMLVDSIVARMWRRDAQMGDCVRVYYCTGRSMHSVGILLGLPRLKVRELLVAGRAYVEACLDMAVVAA